MVQIVVKGDFVTESFSSKSEQITVSSSLVQLAGLFAGCQNLRVIDGCWKLCLPHCMMAVPMEVNGYPLINFPNVCISEPKPGSVFCAQHEELLKKNNVPTVKQEFLKYLGCKGKWCKQPSLAFRFIDLVKVHMYTTIYNVFLSWNAHTGQQFETSRIKKRIMEIMQ